MRYTIEPQRDWFKLHPDEKPDDDSTWFVPCEDADADHFAVFRVEGEQEPELLDDFPTRAEAEAFVKGRAA